MNIWWVMDEGLSKIIPCKNPVSSRNFSGMIQKLVHSLSYFFY